MSITYTFSAPLWEYGGEASWVFVTVPAADSDEITDVVPRRRGFGSVKVAATIGSTEWSTSLFPSKELGSYVLPIKRAVRDREALDIGEAATVSITVETD